MRVKINLEKYKEIKKEEARRERTTLFNKLDVEFMRAIESEDTEKKAEIVALKQALRDATSDPVIVNATTPEQLKDARPAILDIVKNR